MVRPTKWALKCTFLHAAWYPESDYTIFVWRQKSVEPGSDMRLSLHVHDPSQPVPRPPAYQNPSFYQFRPKPVAPSPPRTVSGRSQPSVKSGKSRKTTKTESKNTIPDHRKEFEDFHSQNGVRTIMGGIGPVHSGASRRCSSLHSSQADHVLTVRMLLKNGYRHVYISRKFALRHGFIPVDAAPGHYGYSGLVKYVSWYKPLGTRADK